MPGMGTRNYSLGLHSQDLGTVLCGRKKVVPALRINDRNTQRVEVKAAVVGGDSCYSYSYSRNCDVRGNRNLAVGRGLYDL